MALFEAPANLDHPNNSQKNSISAYGYYHANYKVRLKSANA